MSKLFPQLPPYTHVPGVTPHPISHADGHMANQDEGEHHDWNKSAWMKWGRTLFNAGFYWEAHEAWEHLWISLGRRGHHADCVKGLIKLAACGVKVLEANEVGAIRHANRAVQLLGAGQSEDVVGHSLSAGLLIAEQFVANPTVPVTPSTGKPTPIAGFCLDKP